ncbi:LppA family lipoprotein [Nocardia sp. NPDC024068]|uniref:LppA family lipoprotein n=1 Tax=Nocardia sp. NPDC024068 TaxID=3157197 RepID=UPI0033CA4D86
MAARPALLLTAALIAFFLTGCASSDDTATADEIAHAEAEMRELPSLEQTYDQLTVVVQRIADATETAAPELTWEPKVNRAQGTLGCPDAYFETDGVSMTTDKRYSPTPISDTAWPRVLDAARTIAAESGMTVLTVRFDEPGHHDITLHSPDHGNQITIGTRVAASLGGVTGCRYRAEDLPTQQHR